MGKESIPKVLVFIVASAILVSCSCFNKNIPLFIQDYSGYSLALLGLLSSYLIYFLVTSRDYKELNFRCSFILFSFVLFLTIIYAFDNYSELSTGIERGQVGHNDNYSSGNVGEPQNDNNTNVGQSLTKQDEFHNNPESSQSPPNTTIAASDTNKSTLIVSQGNETITENDQPRESEANKLSDREPNTAQEPENKDIGQGTIHESDPSANDNLSPQPPNSTSQNPTTSEEPGEEKKKSQQTIDERSSSADNTQ